jgi:hypothetical protein
MLGSENALDKQGVFNSIVRADYLVGDGLAVFDEFVVVEVDEVFEWVAVLFDGIVDEFEFMFDVGAVVVEVDEVLVTVADVFDVEVFIMFEFERFVFVLFAVSPPQAAPRAARPKSAESAIAFFILKTISCLSQRLILRSAARGRFAPKLFLILEQTK